MPAPSRFSVRHGLLTSGRREFIRSFIELCIFLGREVKAPQVRRVDPASKSKIVHFIRITHRDEVEPPVTDWLREAYEFSEPPTDRSGASSKPPSRPQAKRTFSRKT